jgi:hypothetical protein
MARVPYRSSPVASPPPAVVVPIRPNGHRLTEEELHRRFCSMLDRVYMYADKSPKPLRAAVEQYRDYLRRISLQDLHDDE